MQIEERWKKVKKQKQKRKEKRKIGQATFIAERHADIYSSHTMHVIKPNYNYQTPLFSGMTL